LVYSVNIFVSGRYNNVVTLIVTVMGELVKNMITLGLKEYEAKVYAALVGIGEGNARQIHEVSGVPRPRVYDILDGLAEHGYVNVRHGKPNFYIPVEPAVVVNRLKGRIEDAATDAILALEALSLDARKKTSPIWYVQGEWSIRRHLESLIDMVKNDLSIVCMDYNSIGEFSRKIAEASKEHRVDIILPNGKKGITRMLGNAGLYIPTEFCEYFQKNIFQQVFKGNISCEDSEFLLEYIFVGDEQECMIIYLQNGVRMAVVITLPFITRIQKKYITKMTDHAKKIE